MTFKCTPAPQDCSGWYRSDVTVDWTVLTADASVVTGCQDKTFTADTPGTNEFCSADDGSATVTVQLKIRVDQTPPVVTGGQPARAADVDGWYNRAVGLTFGGSDLTSGIDSCTSTTYGGPDSASASVAGTCVDNAGNASAPLSYGLKYDATAPTVAAAQPERQANENGWFNRAVAFDVQGTDATSGVADCPPVTYGGPDSATATFMASCRDRAGNSAARSFALKYDATAPAVTSSTPDRPPDAGGWYNRPVTVGFGGNDAMSGVDGCTTKTYPGPDTEAVSLTGTCTDKAGNVSGVAGRTIKYDATAPAVTGSQAARAPDGAGWYNRAVGVAFSGTDAMSGVDACTAAAYGGPDSAAATVPGTCRDKAGNVSAPSQFGLKYDATGPTVTGLRPERPPDHGSWFVSPVRFSFTGTDAMSGLDVCPLVEYAGPDGAGALLVGRCRDRAGNAGTRSFTFDYDATPPSLSLSAESGDRSVALSWQTSPDATSVEVVRTPGVGGRPSSVVFNGPGTSFVDGLVDNGTRYAYEVKVVDAAGNTSTQSVVGIPAPSPLEAQSSFSAAPGVVAVPGPTTTSPPKRPAISPAAGSVFRATAPPLLQWPTARRAAYYNVQLFRGERKLLSVWPARPRYQLEHTWKFRGKLRRLVAGTYRWMVWPGYGRRSKGRYGKPIVRSTFVIQKVPR